MYVYRLTRDVVDGIILNQGNIPSEEDVEGWLSGG
jgi:hypothetical protein